MAAVDASFSLFEDELFGAKAAQPSASHGSSRSRSTSAGSSPACSSIEQPTPELKAAKPRVSELPEISYPSPLMVRNTFLDFVDSSPKSYAEFLPERQAQSCPGSKLAAPLGLEHFGSQISECDDDADFVPVRPEFFAPAPTKIAGLPDFEYPSPIVVRNTFLDIKEIQHLGSLADFVVEREIKSLPASCIGLPPGLSGVCSRPYSAIDELPASVERWGSGLSAAPAYEPALPNVQCATLPPPPPTAPPAQIFELTTLMLPPPPLQAPQLRIAEALPETRLGTAEMPTVGSAEHHSGNCKPCAFLFTKGCNSGLSCSFCHLCAPGEKKRRQKIKHATAKMSAKLATSGSDLHVATASATSSPAAHSALQTASVYRQAF